MLAMAIAPTPALATLLHGAVPVPLHSGVNRIADFAGDGRAALVTMGWRDNGNAHGYSLFGVLLPDTATPRRWTIVGIERAGAPADTIADDPHTGEDVVTAVRFVRATGAHRRQTLLVTATRHWQDSIPAAAPTTITVYTLHSSAGAVGHTQDYFAPALSVDTTRRYCNADMALHQEAGLPLPADYAGGAAPDGCG